MNKEEEREIVENARHDPEAFGVIFDSYFDAIYNYILRRTGNVFATQDIASETFYKAMAKLSLFRWKNISISSWLYRIATNEMNQYYRQNKRLPQSLDKIIDETGLEIDDNINILEEIIAQEKKLLRAQEWKQIRKSIASLSEKYQSVLTLRYFEDKKVSEIAEILGMREGTVKSLLSRAIKKLQDLQPKE